MQEHCKEKQQIIIDMESQNQQSCRANMGLIDESMLTGEQLRLSLKDDEYRSVTSKVRQKGCVLSARLSFTAGSGLENVYFNSSSIFNYISV